MLVTAGVRVGEARKSHWNTLAWPGEPFIQLLQTEAEEARRQCHPEKQGTQIMPVGTSEQRETSWGERTESCEDNTQGLEGKNLMSLEAES